jgi:hypothetical protein
LISHDSWSANIEAIRCAHTLKSFFAGIDSLKDLILRPCYTVAPRSYQGAYIQAQAILDDQISELRPPYTESSLHIDQRAAAILRFESDMLLKHLRRIRSKTKNVLKWLKLGFKSADVLLGTLQSFFPPLAFVKEFKEQLENFVSEVDAPERASTKLFESLVPKEKSRTKIRTRAKTRPKNKKISLIS